MLDPFMGTGPTALAAEKHGRDWLGIELNPAYAEMSMERIAAARQKQDRAA
ncbi:MAG: DNA methyltransferase [Pseudonocardia sp.]